jgi:hypothetical protein
MSNVRKPRARKRATDIDELSWAFINDRVADGDDVSEYGAGTFDLWELTYNCELGSQRPVTLELWQAYGTVVLQRWALEKPGTRPSLWWQFDAPRGDFRSYGNNYNLPGDERRWAEPRRRLGGIGTPRHEVLSVSASFAFGIPTSWVSRFEVDYYRGLIEHPDDRVRGGRREPIDRDFPGLPIDPLDPPRYEAEAAYLKRHALFMDGEAKRLRPRDFWAEKVMPEEDGEEG